MPCFIKCISETSTIWIAQFLQTIQIYTYISSLFHSYHLGLDRSFVFAKDLIELLFPLKQKVSSKDDNTRTTKATFFSKLHCISMWKPQDLYLYFHLLADIQNLLPFYWSFFFFFNVNSTKTFHFAGRKETVLFGYILEELDFDKFTLLFSHRFQVNYFSVAAWFI